MKENNRQKKIEDKGNENATSLHLQICWLFGLVTTCVVTGTLAFT